jgi:succinate-semialdehyde dehydrogenase/glutarate-semialdehyde dehydrogenase
MRSINPATGEPIREYAELAKGEIAKRLQAADDAFGAWRSVGFAERAARLATLAGRLRDQKQRLAALITDEMGKPIAQSESEIDKCASGCEFYAENAERYLARRVVKTDAPTSYVRHDPLGVVLAIMPWNFPFWQVFRFAAPALMAGNVGILKHASNVPGCAEAIETLFHESGFPRGVFQTLLIRSANVEEVIASPVVKAVTLTGSEAAGVSVAAAAGKHLKKSVLELGGSDAFIVRADADVAAAARLATRSRTINTGQSCIAAKRFIVDEKVADPFERHFIEEMERLTVGDPRDRKTDLGPLAREDLLDDLHDQVQRSVKAGARLATGGERLDRRGYFYTPTVLTHVVPGNPAFDEETFGPVAAIIRAAGDDHAVELANNSIYGLGATIASRDVAQAQEMAAHIEAGCVFINEFVKSDPRLPFGGVKRSGYGRELAEEGIREFVNIKAVWVQ